MINLDRNRVMSNQDVDQDSTECVALTVTDICGNLDGIIYDPDYNYAATLKLQNIEPTTAGSDPYTGMLSAVSYGLLPISQADFSAKSVGELYVANYQNYSLDDRQTALGHTRNGVIVLDNYKAICNYLDKYQCGVSLALKWYESFNTPNQGGTLPAPLGNFSYHNVAVYGYDSNGLLIKPWLGPTFAQGGYALLSETNFNLVELGMFGFDPNAWRWLSLAVICITHPMSIKDLLPSLKSASNVPPTPTTNPVVPPIPIIPTIPLNSDILTTWDTTENCRHNVRVICDLERLSVQQKNDLSATVHCESNYNPAETHPNIVNGKLSSTDYGICQINDYYHIGEGKDFPSVQYVLDNPEACVRWMCKQWLAGNSNLWVCKLKGLYLNYSS